MSVATAICPWCREERVLKRSAKQHPSNPAQLDQSGFLLHRECGLHIGATYCIADHDDEDTAIAFRCWYRYEDPFLYSTHHRDYEYSWDGYAECTRSNHKAPDPQCVCGLYAYWWPVRDWADTTEVSVPVKPWGFTNCLRFWGAVAVSGRVHHCRYGVRAERMTMLALAKLPTGTTKARSVKLRESASLYKVDILPWPELKEYASQFGRLAADPIKRGGRRRTWHPGMKGAT